MTQLAKILVKGDFGARAGTVKNEANAVDDACGACSSACPDKAFINLYRAISAIPWHPAVCHSK
jgi:ferredoxin